MRKKNWYDSSAEKVSVGDLELLNVDYVFLGDYHRYQKLPVEKNVAMYVGSIERTDFNEIGQKKGFVIFDSDAKEDKVSFIEYKDCRKFVELIGSLNDIKEAAKRIDIENNQKSIVKLTFRGTNADYIEYSKKHDRIKEWINSKLNPVHFIFDREIVSLFAKPSVDPESQKDNHIDASKIEAPEERMVLSVVSDLIDEIEKNDNERISLKKLAEEIYIQTNTVGA
jgi:DNA repair exonuclease SbcCD nuclease subunit